MKSEIDPKRLKDLVALFDGLHKLHEQLLTLIRSKVDAMKRADVPAMQSLSEQEQLLARRVEQREGLRRQLMDKIGEQCGLSSRAARALSVSQFAGRLRDPQRTTLQQAAQKLREIIAKVAQANRVAGTISREVLTHLEWVFASVRPASDQPLVYSIDGRPPVEHDARIFETVG